MGPCCGDEAPIIPDQVDQFTADWALAVMKTWLEKNEKNVNNIKVTKVDPRLNSEQVSEISINL